jgi:nicotinamidase-related amidase
MLTSTDAPLRALVVIDVQQGFDDAAWWGTRNNPDCERNVRALADGFAAAGSPVVVVRHSSSDPRSPLHADRPGFALKPELDGVEPALVVTKHVHSAFSGDTDLHGWLQQRSIGQIVICGIQTNRCCETTARVGGDLGYDVRFAIDATHTFGEESPDGTPLVADLFARVTATNLHGHFAQVVRTDDVLAAL